MFTLRYLTAEGREQIIAAFDRISEEFGCGCDHDGIRIAVWEILWKLKPGTSVPVAYTVAIIHEWRRIVEGGKGGHLLAGLGLSSGMFVSYYRVAFCGDYGDPTRINRADPLECVYTTFSPEDACDHAESLSKTAQEKGWSLSTDIGMAVIPEFTRELFDEWDRESCARAPRVK